MSRSGYTEDPDSQWGFICWRGAVAQAIHGRRGQAFLKDLLSALDTMESKKLIGNKLVADGEVCALGSLGVRRGIDLSTLDSYDYDTLADTFGVAPALIREIEFENDEGALDRETEEQRYERIRKWVTANLKEAA